MKTIKKLCDIKKKNYPLYEDEIKSIVKKPNFICKKCLRVAEHEKHLCKSEPL